MTVPVVQSVARFVDGEGRLTQYGVQLLGQMRTRLSGNVASAYDQVYQLTSSLADAVSVEIDVEEVTEDVSLLVLAVFDVGFKTSTTAGAQFKVQYKLVDVNGDSLTTTQTRNYCQPGSPPSTPFEWQQSSGLVLEVSASSQRIAQGKNTIRLQAAEGTGFGAGDTGFLRETNLIVFAKR